MDINSWNEMVKKSRESIKIKVPPKEVDRKESKEVKDAK